MPFTSVKYEEVKMKEDANCFSEKIPVHSQVGSLRAAQHISEGGPEAALAQCPAYAGSRHLV